MSAADQRLFMEDLTLETSILLRILDVSRRMAERRAFAPLLSYVIDEAMKLAGAERGYVVLLGADGTLDFRVTRDRDGNDIANAADQISTSILRKVVDSGEPLILRDAMSDPRFSSSRSVMNLHLRSILCVPLVSYGKTIGGIYLENRSIRGRFKETNLSLLILFANQASVAIENAVLNDSLEARVAERTRELAEANAELISSKAELQQRMDELQVLHLQMQELSIRDGLTGLYNRRYLDEQMRQLFAVAERYDWPLAVAIADIDGFKRINDTFSHQVGDLVLRAIGQIMHEQTRNADVLARFGGEEFVLLLPETSLEEAVQCCERIRVEVMQFDWRQIHADLQVTISFGVALNRGYTNVEEQLRAADERLYAAKRAGKNRVVAQ
jgi:diguanylate cyclase (GGDEF)-like protein